MQAALSGYSDLAMRAVAREHGATYAINEVVLDSLVLQKGKLQRRILSVPEYDHPVGGQLMGSQPETFGDAARALVKAGYDVVDINFGCPVNKVLGRRRGGWLLQDTDTALQIIDSVVQSVQGDAPVSVKMRRGTDDSPEAVNAYLNILRALFNLTNATHTNSSARSVTGQFFQQRMSLLATDSLTSTDGESKYTDNDNAEGIYQAEASTSRLRSLRRSLQQIAVDSGLLQAVPPSPPARAKEALDEFVRPAWNDYYTDETIRNDPQFGSYYTAASMSPLEAYHFYRKIKCEAEQRLMFFEIEAIIKDPTARTAWLLLNTDFGLADMLAGLGLIPCRDRTSEQRPALEIFPAPSPPPPLDDWVNILHVEPSHTYTHTHTPAHPLATRAHRAGRSSRRRRRTTSTR